MTCILDPAVTVGQMRFAIISQTSVAAQGFPNSAFFAGRKRPLYVLMQNGDTVSAFDLSGCEISLTEIETRCPGLCGRFASTGDTDD